MSRFVDSLPAPAKPRDMKVVSLSMSRNGTNGLYTALKILGFKPYHVVEILPNGIPHLKMVGEATRAVRTDRGRYSRADFDKLLGEYDAACVPFFIEDLVRAYPDAKFVLITREPQAWLTSMKKTVIKAAKEQGRFPATLFQYLDPTLWHFRRMTEAWISLWWPSGNIDDDEEAFRTYDKHNRLARGLVPPERLLELKLEDGVGWEPLCAFLGVDVPNVPYPRTNVPDEFGERARLWRKKGIQKVLNNALSVGGIAAIGVAAWYWMDAMHTVR